MIRIIIVEEIACYLKWANTQIRKTCWTNVPAVGRQRKNLKDLLDECASGWRTTKKLVVKGELVMLRYYNSPFELVNNKARKVEY